MSIQRFSKLLLVVLALALCAGTASAQIVGTTQANLTYRSGGTNTTSATSSITNSNTPGDTYSVGTITYGLGASGWVGTPTSGNSFTLPDTLTIPLTTVAAGTLPAGTYTATIPLVSGDATTSNITATLVVTSPLSATSPGSATLTWVVGGGVTQAASTTSVTVSDADTSYDAYTVVPSGTCPNWLTSSALPSTLQAKSTQSDVLTFAITAANLNGVTSASITTCTVALQYNGGTFSTVTFTKLAVVSQPLLSTAPTALLAYNKSSLSGTTSTSVTVKVAANTASTPFSLDLATLPPWLSVTGGLTLNAANATPTGNAVTFGLVTAVAAALPTGNYAANVGFYATGFADLLVPITVAISNAAPTASTIPSTQTNISFTSSMANPTPSAAIYSSGDAIPFTATCTVAHTASYTAGVNFTTPCLLNGGTNVVNGTTFTWGYALTAALDPVLFSATIGNTITVTITFTGLSSPPSPVVYQYTLQPGLPTVTTVSPSSASATFSHSVSLVAVVKGTNFIGPGSISGTAIVPTQVWVAGTLLTSANAATAGTYVVYNANTLLVTIPGSVFPAVTAGHTGTIAIGVANQTGLVAPAALQASLNLNITYNPEIYAMTSTASYIQPNVGSSPSFAPYELVSIFGDNFGYSGSASSSSTLDSYGKVVTPLTVTAAVGSTKATTLAVTFKDVATGKVSFTAPVLFANSNQINLIVPGGVVGDQNVSVTAVGLTSDTFVAHTVPADPSIFSLSSDGAGPGAIINQNGTVNSGSNKANPGDTISIYLAGLGMPDSTNVDVAGTNPTNFPATCVAISDTAANSPGLLQVVNTKVGTTYASPGWTNIDGAMMSYGPHDIIMGNTGDLNYPPCMATATIVVNFGPASNVINDSTVTYAGFVSGSVAGLYQINVTLPTPLNGSAVTSLVGTGANPVSVSITPNNSSTTYTSQAGVTIVF